MQVTHQEETLTEFRSKATGTATDWVQMPGMKLALFALVSCGIVSVSHGCQSIDAHAYGLVNVEPPKRVPPAVVVRFLRERRYEWADYNFDAYSTSALMGQLAQCGPYSEEEKRKPVVELIVEQGAHPGQPSPISSWCLMWTS